MEPQQSEPNSFQNEIPQQQQQQYQPKNETDFNQMTETLQVSETFQNTYTSTYTKKVLGCSFCKIE